MTPRLLSRSLLVCALGAIALVSPLRAQSNMLQPGRRIEARPVKGATDTYTVSIAAGQYVHVVVEQPQLTMVERVRGNDGLVIDGLGGPDLQVHGRPDRIVLIAESPAEYQIDLRTVDGDGNGYAIAIVEQGELNAVERQRFEAQRLRANAVVGTTGRPWTLERRALLERSRSISRDIGDPIGEVDALLSLGLSYLLSDRPAGRPYFLAAIDVATRAGDLRSELEALNNLGETAIAMGEPRQAVEHLLRGLEVGRQVDPSRPNVLLIYHLSLSYREASEFQLALRYGHEALAHWREAGDTAGEGYAANNVGMTHFLLGDTDTALEYLTLAFDRWRSVQHGTGIARSLTTIGFARAARGEHREAIDNFREAITAWRAIGATGDVFGESGATRSLAMSLAALGRWNEAAPIYARALMLARQSGGRIIEADTLRGLGELRRATGDPAQAAVLFEQSLTMARASEDRSGAAATLLALARLARERGRLDESRPLIEEALGLIESLRTTVSSPDLRASFAATRRDYYDFYIDLLMQLHRRNPGAGHEVAALMASERGRARSLLEMLTETGADIRSGAPSALLEKERVLQQDVTIRSARLTRLMGGAHTDDQAAAARAELQQAVTAYDDAQARVRAESPRYAALSQPPPLDLPAMRQRVLDGETALIEYALGQERSYAWVVTRDSLSAYELPSRAVIEEAARQAHDLFAGSNRREVWGPAARAAARLSDLILAPVVPRLSHRRLLVVADGALHYVPFAALPKPGSSAPMVAAHEIVNLPSASALAVIRAEAAGRRPAANRVAVLADPVLAPSDARVSGAPATADRPAAGRSDLLRSAAESGIPHFERLAFTRDEATAIAAVAGRSRSMVSLDFDASRATALGTALADYRVVHFATHGLINSANPQLSGLVLSLVDRQGHPQDGFVRLHDIYNMKLAADLVVLSACRTALGKDVRGEGLVGMTRGFMYAGAPRVVASLWDVRDRATAELMTRFYTRMLTGGLSPAAALRAAQLSMWKEPRWQAPFNWAGFVIQGEWNGLP